MALDPSMPVLVVDDYSTMVRIIRNLLRQVGFSDVDDANDGAAALAKMRAKRYGLVISDWNMEPMSGYELAAPGSRRSRAWRNTVHHADRRIQNGQRHRREEGGREQLHRQAVQRADAQNQDRGGVR
jgi:DNA-binding NtrC family response regulator